MNLEGQTPDPAAKDYFVSVVNGDQYILALGPWLDHESALARVEEFRTWACEYDSRAHWYAYGTCSLPLWSGEHGRWNETLQPQPTEPKGT